MVLFLWRARKTAVPLHSVWSVRSPSWRGLAPAPCALTGPLGEGASHGMLRRLDEVLPLAGCTVVRRMWFGLLRHLSREPRTHG